MSSSVDLYLAQNDPEAPNRFLDRLAVLVRGDWLEAVDRTRRLGDRSPAIVLLDAVISHHGLDVDAWYANDGVDTAVAHVFGRHAHRSAADEVLIRVARSTAAVAARSLLVHDFLSGEHFDTLYHPFATAIPAATVVSF